MLPQSSISDSPASSLPQPVGRRGEQQAPPRPLPPRRSLQTSEPDRRQQAPPGADNTKNNKEDQWER